MKKKYVMITFISMFLMLISVMGTVSAANYTVNPGDSIQSVINNASSNDTVIVNDNNGSAYTYTENLVINKKLSLQAKTGSNITIQALNSSLPVFTINSGGSGSVIRGFTIKSATNSTGVLLNSVMNCTIQNNSIYGNNYGIDVFDSSFNNITQNMIKGNNYGLYLTTQCISLEDFCGDEIEWYEEEDYYCYYEYSGIHSDSQGNIIKGNSFTNNYYGLYLKSDECWSNLSIYDNHVIENNIAGNSYGIFAEGVYIWASEVAHVHFNRIENNTLFGIYLNEIGVNATNNWWGSSNSPIISSSSYSDIRPYEDPCYYYSPWLVLGVSANPTSTNNNSTVTADLTHNSNGNDTSSQGHIPDDIPVNFTTTLGTVTSPAYTRNGKASTTFNRGTTTSGTANIIATVDNQTVQTNVTIHIVTNINTGNVYSTIQDAINDPLTLNGHIIELKSGTYTENIFINKMLTIRPFSGHNVTICALNSLNSVFTINSFGNGTVIQGFTITGATNSSAIYLNGTSNCNITGNNLTSNNQGVNIASSNNNIIQNNIMNNIYHGIAMGGSNNTVRGNTISGSRYGIYLNYSTNAIITGNSITNTVYGINPQRSSASIHFNRITGNSGFSLVVQGNSTINATNNWWGNNTPSYINSPNWVSTYYDIYNCNSTTYYNPWLVLNVTANPTSTNSNSTVTADLTHNSAGNDTSSQGHLPDNIPINFTTNLGTVTSSAYTRNGKASATFNRGSSTSGTATVTATLNNQTKQITVIIDMVSPTVSSTDPANNAVNVPINKVIKVTFNEPVKVGSNWIELYKTSDGTIIPVTTSISGNVLTITPNSNLTKGTTYSTAIHTGSVTDLAGNNVALCGSTFTTDSTPPTVSSTDPANNAVNVPTNKVIKVTFSEPVKAGSLWIEFKNGGGTPIPIATSVSGSILTVTPVNSLAGGRYTLTLHTGSITDLAGNNLALCGFSFNVSNTVKNLNTNVTYSSIQSAVNAASSGNTIQVSTGIYTENVYITKKIILKGSTINATIQALNTTLPSVRIISGGSGTTITGFTIQGATNCSGLFIYNVTNCNITGNIITGNGVNNGCSGIWLYYANNTNITGNTVINSGLDGIEMDYTKNNKISGNTVTGNVQNGIFLYNSNSTIISGNNVTGNNVDGIAAGYANNNTLSGNNITANIHNGIDFSYANNNTISGNNIAGNTVVGVHIEYASVNHVSGNNITGNGLSGIFFNDAINNSISGNNVTGNTGWGIYLYSSNSTNVSGNNATNNTQGGIYLDNSNNNTMSVNNASLNGWNGILLAYSNNNTLSGNNAINNARNGFYLDGSNNNTLSGNNAISNAHNGIYLDHANDNCVSGSNAKNNSMNGMGLSYADSITLSENNVVGNNQGILLDHSSGAVVTKNNVTGNNKGICLSFSPASVNLNRIFGNTQSGLFNEYSSFVNATNNWWGTNTPVVSSSNVSDIYIMGGNVIYDPWIVLTVNSVHCTNGTFNITADLTRNNQGTDLSSLGHVPDGIAVNFTTDYGTIVESVNTINGKAVSQLNSTINGIANVTVTLDNQIVSKTVNLFNIYNTVTQKGFTSIQAAIDDTSTSDGDIIEVMGGTYRENVVINKRLIIRAFSGENVTIQALNSSSSIITVNPGVTVTIFNIKFINGNTTIGGAIYNRGNLTVSSSTFTGNHATNGGAILNYGSLTVSDSIFTDNPATTGGAIDNRGNLTVSSSTFTGNHATTGGAIDNRGNLTVLGSTFASNSATIGGAIYNYGSSANINFNRIVGNSNYGLYNAGNGTVNATNNWWGTNTPIYSISWSPSVDILNQNGTVTYNPWLVLNVSADPANTSGNSTVTADLTHNSNGDDTSSEGHVPDNIPVNFTTTLGTLASPGYTRNGKAVLTFNPGTITSGTANITATLDGQSVQTNVIIDTVVPIVNATLASGLYNVTQSVNLTASDAIDSNPIIYYTTDGSTPTVSSTVYAGPITIATTTTLKFMAVDFTGNKSPVGTKYYIFSPVGNLNTGLGYSSIQNAIDDNLTVNGNVIVVANGTYIENILVNKNLTISPYDGNVTVQAANPNNPVITINSGGSGSVILGFTITGANDTSSSGIYLNQASNCTIVENILTNNYYGLLLSNSIDNMIWDNNLTSNLMGAIQLNSSNNNTIYSNIITNNSGHGIYLYNSENTLIMANTIQNNLINGIELNNSNNSTIYQNTITDNHQNGIKATSSSADINFNIITGNTLYGLYNIGNGTLNATNNWWGTNNPAVSSISPSDINIAGGTVVYDPWLVLNLTGSIITVTHNNTSDCEITADLTHDNHGDDTSSSGTIPDGLPVNFTTTLGTINSTGTTRRGETVVVLTSSPSDGATTVTATVNNQQVSKAFHKSFSSIQAAVSDPLTVDGDVIFVTNGTYVESIVVNKNLTIISEGNVTVQALNSSNPVFTVNDCSDSMIYGFTITGVTHSSAIYLNRVNNCYVLDNTITGNGLNSTGDFGYGIFMNSTTNCTVTGNILQGNLGGIDLEYSNNTLISGNNITNSTCMGVYLLNSDNTTISQNNLANNDLCGISSEYSNSFVITENNIKNNICPGISLYYSSGELHFNRIVGNGQYGLYNRGGTVNATNNWWGTNEPNLYGSLYRDIYVYSGTVLYDPWLVLTVTPTSYKVSDGKIYESTITADLNHNSNGEYLSTITYVPEGIPVNFTSDNNSTILNTGSTVKGVASSTLVLDPNLQSGLTNVTAVVDGQSVSTAVDRSANAVILIASTAIDLSTGQPLSLSYILPLNESVSWVSVLWKSTSSEFGAFQNEVDLIVNGVVVLNRTVSNINYLYYKNSYSQKVWYNVNFLNWLFSNSASSQMALQNIIYNNPQLQNLTGSELEVGLLNIIKQEYNFTDSEMFMIANHRYFTDDITTYINYPGDAAKKITIENPDSNELISLDFPGNPIFRTSTMIYANGGYFHVDDHNNPTSSIYKDEGYEGVRSFAIVTTRVTDEILRYWLDQKDRTDVNGTLLYPEGPMKAAYGTFLEALLVVKCHDIAADAAASKYNVTWSRTTPIVVSVCDDAAETYITGEMDHRMGMDVVGDPDNVKAFRYACSSSFSLVEYWVGRALFPSSNSTDGLMGSVTMGLGYMMLSGEPLEIFESNGYTVIRAVGDDQRILIIDPETGLVMDGMMLNGTISGTRCYGDQQTEWANGYGNSILDNEDVINGIMVTGEAATDFGQGSDEWKDEVLGFAGSTAISVGIAACIVGGPIGILIGIPLIGLGLVSSWYAADMDEDMYSPSNQINFILNVGPSFIPFIGWESSIGGKLCVKTLTSKGVSKKLFNIPKNYDGYVIQNIKSMGSDYTKGPLTGGSITSARYINHGSPEGVARITFGWTEKEAAAGITTDYLLNRESYVIDRYGDNIDGAFGYRKYNSTAEYLATV